LIRDFYLKQIEDQGSLELDLSQIIGIGGESIILKSHKQIDDPNIRPGTKLAVKTSPCEIEVNGGIGFIDARLSKENQRLPELIPVSFKHKHIIKYFRNVFQKAGPTLFHLSGMLNRIL